MNIAFSSQPIVRICVVLFSLASTALAVESLPVETLHRETPVDFAEEILPVLRRNCLACHNETKAKAGLILESPTAILKGGDNGPAVVPGDPAQSLLFSTSAHLDDPIMPPPNNASKAKNLTPPELGLLKKWIEEGAVGGSSLMTPAPDKWNRSPANQVIRSVAVSADGRFIAYGRGHQIVVYDWKMGRLAGHLTDSSLDFGSHLDVVHSLAFAPDGTLGSGGFREIKIWHRPIALPVPIEGEVPASTPDSRLVIEGTSASVSEGDQTFLIKDSAPIAKASLSPDSSLLVTAWAKGKATLWQMRENKIVSTLDLAPEHQAHYLRFKDSLVIRERLVSVYTKKVSDLETALKKEEEVATESANALPELELALEGAIVEKGSHREKERFKKALGLESPTTDDPVILAEGQLATARRKLSSALKTTSDAVARHTQAKLDLAAAVKGRDLTKAKGEEVLKLKAAAETAAEVIAVVFIGAGSQVALVLKNGAIYLYSSKDGQHLETLDTGQEWKSAAFQGESLITTSTAGKSAQWSLARNWQLSRTIGDGKDGNILVGAVTAVAFNSDGERLLSASGVPSRTGNLKLWDPETGDLIESRIGAHHDIITSIAFSPDGGSFVSGSADKFAKIFSIPSLSPLKSLESHTQQVLTVDWSPDGLTIATGSSDHSVKLWDVESGEENRTVKKDFEIRDLRFLSPTGDALAMACGDDTVKNEGSEYENSANYTYAIELTPNGKYLVAGGDDGKLRIWDAASRKLLNILEAVDLE